MVNAEKKVVIETINKLEKRDNYRNFFLHEINQVEPFIKKGLIRKVLSMPDNKNDLELYRELKKWHTCLSVANRKLKNSSFSFSSYMLSIGIWLHSHDKEFVFLPIFYYEDNVFLSYYRTGQHVLRINPKISLLDYDTYHFEYGAGFMVDVGPISMKELREEIRCGDFSKIEKAIEDQYKWYNLYKFSKAEDNFKSIFDLYIDNRIDFISDDQLKFLSLGYKQKHHDLLALIYAIKKIEKGYILLGKFWSKH